MSRSRSVLVVMALVFVFSSVSSAQKAEVKAIDSYVASTTAFTKKRANPKLVFADVSNAETEQPSTYQKFASEKALEKYRDKSEVYSIAYAWKKGGKVVATNFTLSSPSGDWVKYNYHVFRSDGTLAMVESNYRTFMGDFSVVRKRYFDAAGKEIHKTTKIFDLTTNKPKKAPGGIMGDDPDEVDYYLTTALLPFADLLKGK